MVTAEAPTPWSSPSPFLLVRLAWKPGRCSTQRSCGRSNNTTRRDTIAHQDRRPADHRGNAPARRVIEPLWLEDGAALRPGVGHYCLAERVLGSHFCGGGGLKDRPGRHALRRYDRLHFRPAEGEGAGLVENDRIDPAQALKIEAALDNGAKPRRTADAAQDRQRRASGFAAGAEALSRSEF
jgi:hypothetical protein